MNHTRLLSGASWRKVFDAYDVAVAYKIQGIILLGYPHDVDQLGFAKGEKKHGATVWQSTERRPFEYYVVNQRSGNTTAGTVGPFSRWKLRIFSGLLQRLLCIVRALDRAIHRIEVDGRNPQRSEQ